MSIVFYFSFCNSDQKTFINCYKPLYIEHYAGHRSKWDFYIKSTYEKVYTWAKIGEGYMMNLWKYYNW